MRIVKILMTVLFIVFFAINCNKEVHYLFKNKKEIFTYKYNFQNNKGEVKIEISYNELISKKMNLDCYDFKSIFFNGFVFKNGNKIYFMNKKETIKSVFFDFDGLIGDKSAVCLSEREDCYGFQIDSIYNDNKFQKKILVYSLVEVPEVYNNLPITSPSYIKQIYVNENSGIIKFTQTSRLGLITYNLID